MNFVKGKNYLINTSEWFIAPDGDSYKAVYGTLKGVFSSEETLGVKTNARSSNWYVVIGNMIVAGCQILYAMETDCVNFNPVEAEVDFNGERKRVAKTRTRIYNANSTYLTI